MNTNLERVYLRFVGVEYLWRDVQVTRRLNDTRECPMLLLRWTL